MTNEHAYIRTASSRAHAATPTLHTMAAHQAPRRLAAPGLCHDHVVAGGHRRTTVMARASCIPAARLIVTRDGDRWQCLATRSSIKCSEHGESSGAAPRPRQGRLGNGRTDDGREELAAATRLSAKSSMCLYSIISIYALYFFFLILIIITMHTCLLENHILMNDLSS